MKREGVKGGHTETQRHVLLKTHFTELHAVWSTRSRSAQRGTAALLKPPSITHCSVTACRLRAGCAWKPPRLTTGQVSVNVRKYDREIKTERLRDESVSVRCAGYSAEGAQGVVISPSLPAFLWVWGRSQSILSKMAKPQCDITLWESKARIRNLNRFESTKTSISKCYYVI